VWKVAEGLHELYVDIGVSLQALPYWYDQELRPYLRLIPTPVRSSIPG
jgi:hypothetical protein